MPSVFGCDERQSDTKSDGCFIDKHGSGWYDAGINYGSNCAEMEDENEF